VSSFAAAASLIVATSQLMQVQAVIGAARAADIESGDVVTPSGIVEKPGIAPTPDAQPQDPSLQPARKLINITQAIYIRPHLPRTNPGSHAPRTVQVQAPTCDLAPEPACSTTSPIQPPWKILPWMQRPQPRIVWIKEIKLIAAPSDMSQRGQVLDLVV
jgi:hypothetical protein